MKVLFCSSEVVPFAKTGGLADVSGALPQALEKEGAEVKVALPGYRSAKAHSPKMGKDIEVYLVQNDKYFDRKELYGTSSGDYPDNLERFAFFCKQTLLLLKEKGFCPDIIHCNDWQSALIPVYLKTNFKDDDFFKKTKVIFTIHNLAYQGVFPQDEFAKTDLDKQLFNMHALEFYGKANLLKGGLVFSRFITTVSPTYAQQIQSVKFGCGLDGVLRKRKKDLSGIINGLDYHIWDPQQDNKIFQKYGRDDLGDKYINKEKLQQELNLPVDRNIPLLGIVTRLASQKGIELIISALNKKMPKLNLQFVLLGTGDEKYHHQLEKIMQRGYKNISISLRFDAVLARKIYAGCDMFLMPSYYEPCGLGQLISLKYGTIPIGRKTGGLADTIIDAQNGFLFEKYSPGEMMRAIMRALKLYENREKWRSLMLKAMDCDFSWEASAKKYIELYGQALKEV
ncbi:MAG: glycogen synthase [Candidatus Omnitrophota bacterium]|nr:MAG: glycogen synthase [Candidatus Omnitrophota bacterium]